MADRRTALLGAFAWWFARRWMKRRAALAVAGIATGAAQRGRLRAVGGALAVVAALAAAFLVWRKLFARADEAPTTVSGGPAPSTPVGGGSVTSVGADAA
jgi:hypothetical protein